MNSEMKMTDNENMPDEIWAQKSSTVYMDGSSPLDCLDRPHPLRGYTKYVRADIHEKALARIAELEVALRDLLDDTQHIDHDCGDDEYCPVLAARAALKGQNQ